MKAFMFFALASVAGISAADTGVAEELANIFGTEEQQVLSREASAEAIRAIELAMSALRLRELRESTGTEELLAASNALFGAIEKMRSLLDSGLVDFELSDEQMAFVASRLGDSATRYDGIFGEVATFNDLFNAYLGLGERLAFALKLAASAEEGRSALSYFSTELSDFIAIGDVITILSRNQPK